MASSRPGGSTKPGLRPSHFLSNVFCGCETPSVPMMSSLVSLHCTETMTLQVGGGWGQASSRHNTCYPPDSQLWFPMTQPSVRIQVSSWRRLLQQNTKGRQACGDSSGFMAVSSVCTGLFFPSFLYWELTQSWWALAMSALSR